RWMSHPIASLPVASPRPSQSATRSFPIPPFRQHIDRVAAVRRTRNARGLVLRHGIAKRNLASRNALQVRSHIRVHVRLGKPFCRFLLEPVGSFSGDGLFKVPFV